MSRDNWEKTRSHAQHLTKAEIAFIKSEYRAERKIVDIARTLKCSSRVVSKYFGYFRAEGVQKKRPFNPEQAKASRFYRSNFEL